MSESRVLVADADVVSGLRAAADALLGVDLTTLDDLAQVEFMQAVQVQRRRLDAADARLVAALDSGGVATRLGCTSTTGLLVQALHVSGAEASSRVRTARLLTDTHSPTGAALPAALPAAATALAEGTIGLGHVQAIATTVKQLPAALAPEMPLIEEALVEAAADQPPELITGLGREILDRINPNGILDDEADRENRREFWIRQHRDGTSTGGFHGSVEFTETALTILDALTKPGVKPSSPACDEARGAQDQAGRDELIIRDPDARDPDGCGQDDRTAGQRRHDAILTALKLLLRSEALPTTNGVAATILLTLSTEQLETCTGLATTGHGAKISIAKALQLAADARLIPVVFGKCHDIAAYAGPRRLFTETERLVMTARDRGCTAPGCTAPPLWCQAHHTTDYALTGRTSIDDGGLACTRHHATIDRGWRTTMINGIVHWTAPPWLDPTQTPRRNYTHHPELLLPPAKKPHPEQPP